MRVSTHNLCEVSCIFVCLAAGFGRPSGQNRPREFKRIDFDADGLALEGPGLKTRPGQLK